MFTLCVFIASTDAGIGQSNGESKMDGKAGQFNLSAVRSAMVEWSLVTGDSCRQMLDGHFSGQDSSKGGPAANNELLVLCDSGLFLLKVINLLTN